MLGESQDYAIIAATKTIRDIGGLRRVGGSISAQEEICKQHRSLPPGWKSPVRGRLPGSRRDRPTRRWSGLGLPDKPDYAGCSRSRVPVHGGRRRAARASMSRSSARPTDDLVSDRPGTRFAPRRSGPRAVRPGRTWRPASTRLPNCGSSTSGMRRWCPPTRARRTPRSSMRRRGGRRRRDPGGARRRPLDHGARHPSVAARIGPVGLVHFDTHTDTGNEVFSSSSRTAHRCTGSSRTATSTRGATCRSACGLLAGAGRVRLAGGAGDHALLHARRPGARDRRRHRAGAGDRRRGPTFLTVDVDVLDPAFAPGPARRSRAG